MADTRTIRSLGVKDVGQAYFFSYEEGPPPENHFRVDTLYTGISTGTELTFFTGTNPYLHSAWDAEFGLFRPGEASAHFPLPFLGYMEVGRVTESRTKAVKVGDVVGMTYGHKTGHTVNPLHEFYVTLPADIDPLLGIYVAQMGPICANGILHAAADQAGYDVRTLGDGVRGRNVLVIGAGVVGQLTALFARLHGAANVVISNRTPQRLRVAEAMGLTTLNETEMEPWRYCKEQWHHSPNDRGADLVFQCRAEAESLQMALRSLRPQGTVIDMAFYQGGATEVRLGEEFHHNGLSVRCAQINRVPRGLGHVWNRRRLADETIELLRAYGSLMREHMITHIIPFDQAPEFLDDMAAHYQPQVVQVVLEVSHGAAADVAFAQQRKSEYQRNGRQPAREAAHD